ncbi:MAG: hypothetical protein Q8928_01095 [Bacteroidota bacterium]|nr:hypothetical protein [Bacteroidota bacterium]
MQVFPVFSQFADPISKKLVDRLQTLAQNSTPELIYIQTSKGIYETGEDLWFKAYLLDAHYFTPSALSKTLYLQIFNENTTGSMAGEIRNTKRFCRRACFFAGYLA